MPRTGGINKEKISMTIDQHLLKWIDGEIKKKNYANRSHAIQCCLDNLKKN